jgi:radical SAM superfamily enzyme YgiQ (UPF0313 family)
LYDAIIFTECNGSIGWGRDAGAYTAASALRSKGYSVLVVDFFSHFDWIKWTKIIDRFVSEKTKMIGFSSTHFSSLRPSDWLETFSADHRTHKNLRWNVYFPQPPHIIAEWVAYAKMRNPAVKIVVGGQKVAQKNILKKEYPMVDIWVGGMADVSIVKIIQEISAGIQSNKEIFSEKTYEPLSEKSFRTSKIHWQESDFLFNNEAIPLEISRGCPFRCSFCDYKKKPSGTWIKKSDILREQVIDAWEKFGIHHYMITDFLVNESIEKLKMIHEVFTNLPFKISWSGFARLDLLKKYPEMKELIYESGAKSIQWGIETINKDVGIRINKNTNQTEIELLLESCRKAWGDNIIMGSGFIVGLPGETKDSSRNLIS